MNILENIKEIRQQKRLSQEVMSDKLNISVSNYSRRENGQIEITLSDLAIIAKTFAMTEVELFLWKEEGERNAKSMVEEPRAEYGKREDSEETCRMFRNYIRLLEEKVESLQHQLSKNRAK